ncbi:hypothetical protein L596_026138 [Steinernema carpocapsae]|uniref:Transmembrane protein n=1 Tax=Steinernema carpocapsae TaxID=34508 RepID=A0A4U5M0H0_STECR|nr:hypothetical protein L596_026138 [Steinernema carpocapsae]
MGSSLLSVLVFVVFLHIAFSASLEISTQATKSLETVIDASTEFKEKEISTKEDHRVGITLFVIGGLVFFFIVMGIIYCTYPRLFRCAYRPTAKK